MLNLNELRTKKFLAGAMALLILVLVCFANPLSAGECEGAFIRCVIDAGIATVITIIVGFATGNILGALFGAAAAGGAYGTFCLVGYSFCKVYYEQ
jgi:hypothetical protein